MKIKPKPIPPGKPKNKDVRSREHLTPHEVEKVMMAAKNTGRYGHRDATMMLLSYRHGLRISELLALQWSHIDFHQGQSRERSKFRLSHSSSYVAPFYRI